MHGYCLMRNMLSRTWPLYCLLICWLFTSCKVKYTFSGADIGTARTVSVAYLQNKAPLVSLTLSQTLTEKIKDKFSRETPLVLVAEGGDMHFSGEIVDYTVAPVALQGGTQTALNRLTIRARIQFINKTDEKKNFDQEFSGFADFDANLNFTTLEKDLINTVTTNMVQDIFNKAVINW